MPHRRPCVLLALSLCGCGAIADLFGPGIPNPFEGEDTLLVQLRCDAASAAAASNLVGQRLGLLDLRHSVTADITGGLSITTTNAAHAQAPALGALLVASPDLSFHAVLEDQGPLRPRHDPPEQAVLDAFPATGGRPDMAFDIEAMQAMLELAGGPLPPVEGAQIVERFDEREVYAAPLDTDWQPWLDTLPLPDGAEVVIECWNDMDEGELCSPLLVESPATITAENIASAELEVDEQFYTPHLELIFDEQGKAAFHQLSERLVGRYLAIVSEGEVLSRPKVIEPIPGGRAWLNVGDGMDTDDLLELWRFYALLGSGPLPGPCTLESSEQVQ